MQYYIAWLSGPPPGYAVNTLEDLIPWYSGGFADWIKANKVSPRTGSAYNLSIGAQREVRNLGSKQYELTDHLGNVLATELDKKTGYGPPGLNYTGFNANLGSVSDVYPFGMPIADRSKAFDDYQFGFNGQMKTDEVYGKGNLNTAQFWEFDTRIGRRWNLDPKTQIFMSDYSAFGSNPIRHNDIFGDVFKISMGQGEHGVKNANITQETKDVQSLAVDKNGRDNSRFIKFASNGTVSLDFGNMPKEQQNELINSDKGLKLIDDLINAKDENGRDYTFLYIVGKEHQGISRKDKSYKVTVTGGVVSQSVTDKNIGLSSNTTLPDDLPAPGISGLVRIPQGTFYQFNTAERGGPEIGRCELTIRRAAIVYHELRENWFRTVMKMPYKRLSNSPESMSNGNKGFYQGYDGAHNSSVIMEGNNYGNPTPGAYNYMIER